MTRLVASLTTLLLAMLVIGALAGWTWSAPSSSGATGAPCSRPSGIDASGYRKRGLAVVDVSGDGRVDRVAVLVRLSNRANCRFFLLARGPRFQPAVLRLRDPMVGPGLATAEWPRLLGARPINTQDGSEVLVVVGQGSAIASIGVYGVDEMGRLATSMSGGRQAAFSFGGGNYPAAVDCAGARIVASVAERGPAAWTVTRRFFQVRQLRFVLERSRVVTVRQLRELSEFQGGDERLPFDSCESAR